MARVIKLNQIADFMEGQVDQLVRAVTLEGEKRLKEETPVDTGRLRNNWQTTIEPKLGTISNNLPYAEPVFRFPSHDPAGDVRHKFAGVMARPVSDASRHKARLS